LRRAATEEGALRGDQPQRLRRGVEAKPTVGSCGTSALRRSREDAQGSAALRLGRRPPEAGEEEINSREPR